MQTARRLSGVSSTPSARRRLIRIVSRCPRVVTTTEAINLITTVGHSTDEVESLRVIPRSVFHSISEQRLSLFRFLAEAPFANAFAFMRGLTLCENHGISPFPGSTSLLNPAFASIRQRPLEEWAEIADWIITHCDNPYVPFNFRRTRDQWEECRTPGRTPVEVWRSACELDAEENREKHHRGERHAIRTVISWFRAGKNLDLIASPELRERMIEEMEREILDQ